MSWVLTFAGESFRALHDSLLGASPSEAGAILRCHRAGPNRLVVRDVAVAGPGACRVQAADRLEFEPAFLARELKLARELEQGLILVHTHPFDDHPNFSHVDDDGERRLIPAIQARVPSAVHGAIVLGRKGFRGRVYIGSEQSELIEIREAGVKVTRWPLPAGWLGDETYDRNVRAFGPEGQKILRQTRVGVVGLGGTGSVVVQQLAYLGVGELVLIDPDSIEESNLNRVVGAAPTDVGMAKVDVAAREVKRVSAGRTAVTVQVSNVVNESTALSLRACDFVFSCTDTHGSRAVLNQLAYQYLIPCIDMGLRLDAVEGRMRSGAGRVQYLAPGAACLQCHTLLDPEAIRRELMSEDERRADPYIVGAHEPQPAVISLNSTVASLAVTMFLSALVGLPASTRRVNYRVLESNVKPVAAPPLTGCIVCSTRGALARGDAWPLPVRRAG